MMSKTGIAALTDIFFHSETGQGDSEKRTSTAEFSHQLDTAAVRQSQIADENIKLFFLAQFDGATHTRGRLHMITAPPQQAGKRAISVFVIFHQQNAHGLPLRGLPFDGGNQFAVRFRDRWEGKTELRALIPSAT